MTRLAALALLLTLVACGGGEAKELAPSTAPTSDAVQPISRADLNTVVTALCLEPPGDALKVLVDVAAADQDRFERVLTAMQRACPDVVDQINKVAHGG